MTAKREREREADTKRTRERHRLGRKLESRPGNKHFFDTDIPLPLGTVYTAKINSLNLYFCVV